MASNQPPYRSHNGSNGPTCFSVGTPSNASTSSCRISYPEVHPQPYPSSSSIINIGHHPGPSYYPTHQGPIVLPNASHKMPPPPPPVSQSNNEPVYNTSVPINQESSKTIVHSEATSQSQPNSGRFSKTKFHFNRKVIFPVLCGD